MAFTGPVRHVDTVPTIPATTDPTPQATKVLRKPKLINIVLAVLVRYLPPAVNWAVFDAVAGVGVALAGYLLHVHLVARTPGGLASLLTVGELREWLLTDATSDAEISDMLKLVGAASLEELIDGRAEGLDGVADPIAEIARIGAKLAGQDRKSVV